VISLFLFCSSIFLMVYGIANEFAALPGPWWLHTIILLVMMVLLGYLEGLQVALIDAKKCVEKLSPCALATFNLTKNDEAMGRFLCGRQILVIFTVYLASQVTAFQDLTVWPFTDVPVPEFFYATVVKTGLPAAIVLFALSQLLPQLMAVSHPQLVLRLPGAIVVTGLALTVEYAGLARCAALISDLIRKCMPESYKVGFKKEIEELLGVVYSELEESGKPGIDDTYTQTQVLGPSSAKGNSVHPDPVAATELPSTKADDLNKMCKEALELVNNDAAEPNPDTPHSDKFPSTHQLVLQLRRQNRKIPRFLLPPKAPNHVPPHVVAFAAFQKMQSS